MKKRRINIITCCLALLLLCGCIHQNPEAEGTDPTLVNVTTDVEIDLDLVSFQTISRSSDLEGHERRFIIDVYREGKVIEEKRIVTTQAEEIEEGRFIIPVSLKLHALEYTLAVWSDYVKQGTQEDLHFNTEDLSNVSLNNPYHHDCNQRESFCGTMPVDLTPYRETWEAQVKQHITLKRPQAKFKIISTDTEDFITRVQTRGDNPNDYQVKVSYEYFFPTAYNVTGDVLCGSQVGMGFTVPCNLKTDENGECELASDYIFAGKDASYISLTLEVTDKEEKVISRVTGVQVPFRQGQLTTVTGKFLTTMMKPGISIDNSYEGEFNITIP